MGDVNEIRKILERERLARKEAERILEEKSLEIYQKTLEIEKLKVSLELKSQDELKKLSKRQLFLSKLFNTHPLPLLIISSVDWMVLESNVQSNQLFHGSGLKLKGNDFRSLFIDSDSEDFVQKFQKSNRRQVIEKSVSLRIFNNETILADVTLIKTEYDTIPSIILIVEDLSETEALKKLSEEKEKRYQNLIEKSSDVIYTISSKGYFTYMNPNGLEILGYSIDEIKEIHFQDLVKKSHKEEIFTFYQNQLNSKIGSSYTEFPVISKNGIEIWLGQNVDMSFDDSKVDISVVARDITEKRRFEIELLKSEEKYRSIINNLQLGLLEANEKGVITKAHPSFCEMVGYSNEELEGTDGYFLLDEDGRDVLLSETSNRGVGELGLYEMKLITKAGEIIWVMISGAPTYDKYNNVNGSIGIHLNITDQKELEKELRASVVLAEESLKAKELFLANISHEMRTPLNGIIGLSELLNKDNLLSQESKLKTESILLSSQNLLNLINDLLLLTKVKTKSVELNPVDVKLHSSIESLIQIHKTAAEAKGLRWLSINTVNENEFYFLDEFRFHQVLNNLLSNAIKFTSEGEVSMEVHIEKRSESIDKLEVVISDTGIGIPESEIDKVFGSFEQASNNDVKYYGGTGLGLSIVKEIAELMGGELKVESSNSGTKMVFMILIEKRAVKNYDMESNHNEKLDLTGLNILIAEDNEVNKFVVQSMLKGLGAKIKICSNGREALDLFKERIFDIILMDIRMPEMDGEEATKNIRCINEDIPIIALTANASIDDRNDYLRKGFTDVLSKPFTQVQLVSALRTYGKSNSQILLNRILSVSNNDFGFALELARIFIEDSTQRIEQLKNQLKDQNIELVNSVSHSMKSSYMQLGDDSIVEIIKVLENDKIWTDQYQLSLKEFIALSQELIGEMNDFVVPELEKMSQR